MSIIPDLTALGHLAGVVVPDPVKALLDALDVGPGGAATVNAEVPLLLGAALPVGAAFQWSVVGTELRLTLAAEVTTPAIPLVFEATVAPEGTGSRARLRYTATANGLRFAVGGTIVVALAPTAAVRIENVTLTASKPDIALPGGFGLSLPAPIGILDGIADLGSVTFALPSIVPVLGGLPLSVRLDTVGESQDLRVDIPTTAVGDGSVSGALAWQLAPSFSLADLVPTLTDVALALPAGTTPLGAAGPRIEETVSLRAVLSRPADDPTALSIAVTAESDAPDGLVAGDDIPLGITIVLAPAIAARAGAAGTASVAALYAAATALGSTLAESGGYVLHGVTLEAAPIAGKLTVTLDLEGAVDITDMNLGVASITMDDARPMRVRWRGVAATVDLNAADLGSALSLDFRSARADVVDPGGWHVESIGDVLDIVGTRSGNGSTWIEVDLRFTLDLGPVKIAGATVRGTWSGGAPSFGIRGFEASIELPGVVVGGGSFELSGGVVDLMLWGTLIPLNVGAFLRFGMHPGPVTRFEFALGVDLPAPIPLGPTGLGLYSVAASFGANAGMTELDPADPLGALRRWKPWEGLRTSAGDITIGAGVIVGTAPDGGFAFSALGVLGLTVPDFALRIGLNAALLSGSRQTMAELEAGGAAVDPVGLSLFGGLSATSDAIDIGVEGRFSVPHVLEIRIPIAAHFPFGGSDWFLHAGSDRGLSSVDRPPGPMQATVFPGLPILETGGWAFLMIRGDGIPDVAGSGVSPQGFAVAVGIGFSKTFGVEGILWAKVSASLIAAIGTDPFVVWAKGQLAGEIGLGPFRLGVDATIEIQFGPGDRFDFHFRVCAVIDLWFTTLEGCIEIGRLGGAAPAIDPADEDWPWPVLALADGLGRMLPADQENPAGLPRATGAVGAAAPANAPDWAATRTVWPDAIPLLTFPIAPIPGAGTPPTAGTAHTGLSGAGSTTFEWTLVALSLEPIDANGVPIDAPVPLDLAAWQPAPGVAPDAAAIATARQLALLTRARWLTLVHAADGGAGQPANRDPLRAIAGLCGLRFDAERGWSYGIDAQRIAAEIWHVPRRETPFSAVLGRFARGVGFRMLAPVALHRNGPTAAIEQPSGPRTYVEPVAVSFGTPSGVEDESFGGALRARSPYDGFWNQEGGGTQYAFVLDEPAFSGDLLLRARLLGPESERGLDALERSNATASWAGGSAAAAVTVERGATENEGIVRITLPEGAPVERIEWNVTWAARVDVLGLHALAAADAQAAEQAEKDRQAAVGADAAGAAPGADPADQRRLLEPGTRYRLSATLSWRRRSDDGTGAPVFTPGSTRGASWFFRTAPKPTVVTGGAVWKGGLDIRGPQVQLTLNRFDAHYLDRYLIGYSIPDHEQFVFTGDKPQALFSAPFVRALAQKYDRDIALLLTRTDRDEPAVQAKPLLIGLFVKPRLPLVDLVSPAAEAWNCPQPPRSAAARWPGGLLPSTPYELTVAVPAKGADATAASPQLRGITFVTSAYADPQQQLAALGFVRAVGRRAITAAHASGHLRVSTGAVTGVAVGDEVVEEAVLALDLPPLRSGGPARSSVLWSRDPAGAWAVRGILLESPEPLVRDGGKRMSITAATLGNTALTVRRTDRSGTRMLLLAPTPVVPVAAAVLRLTVTDRATSFFVRITVPAEPAFAGSAIVGRSRP